MTSHLRLRQAAYFCWGTAEYCTSESVFHYPASTSGSESRRPFMEVDWYTLVNVHVYASSMMFVLRSDNTGDKSSLQFSGNVIMQGQFAVRAQS